LRGLLKTAAATRRQTLFFSTITRTGIRPSYQTSAQDSSAI
jgi:hypothetical protein